MRVDARSLVRKLTPSATRLLEAAVGRAAQGGFHEITVEHLLSAMLEPDEGDAARLFANWNVDRKRLLARVEKDVGRMRQGSTARPVISESVFNWLEDAWLLASVDLGASKLRSGHLLVQLLVRANRYLAEVYPELDELKLEEVKRDLDEVLAPSSESAEAYPERAATLAAGRHPAFAGTSAPPAGAPPGSPAAAPGDASSLLQAFAESYLPAGAAVDAPALERMLAATAEVLETAAKSFPELRRGYEEFGREIGIRVETGEGRLVRTRDARSLLAWLLQPAEGESRAREMESGFADLMIHQVALLNGVTEGARELVGRLYPEAVVDRLGHEGGASRLALETAET